MIYSVKPEDKESELEWLRGQRVYPGYSDEYDWITHKNVIKFGVIVGKETALAIKLRHHLDLQDDWNFL